MSSRLKSSHTRRASVPLRDKLKKEHTLEPYVEQTCDSSSSDGKLYIPIPQHKVFAPHAAHSDDYAIVRDKRDKSTAAADSRYEFSRTVEILNADLARQGGSTARATF